MIEQPIIADNVNDALLFCVHREYLTDEEVANYFWDFLKNVMKLKKILGTQEEHPLPRGSATVRYLKIRSIFTSFQLICLSCPYDSHTFKTGF